MRLPVISLRFAPALAVFALAIPRTSHAQQTGTHVSVHVPDTVAHVVDRSTLAKARFAIVSRDGTAALLLMDTTIVAQMTDTGLARINSALTSTDWRPPENWRRRNTTRPLPTTRAS